MKKRGKKVRTFKQDFYVPVELTVHLSEEEEKEIIERVGKEYDGDPLCVDTAIEDLIYEKFYNEIEKYEKQNNCTLFDSDESWYEVKEEI